MAGREFPVKGGTLRELTGAWWEWRPAGLAAGRVRLKLGRDAEGWRVIVELRATDPSGVQAGLLRQIPLGALEEVLNRREVVKRTGGATVIETKHRDGRQDATVRPGSIRVAVAFPSPALLAHEYLRAAAETRHPARLLAERYGVSERTISRRLSEARRQGFLAPVRRGGARR